jgi:chromosome segregation ATPase
LKIPILFGIVIALVAANVYLFLQLDQVRTELTSMRESILDEVSNLRETSTVTSQTHQRRMETMREELEAARRQAAMAAGQAKEQATKRAEELAKRLEAEQSRQREEQAKAQQQLSQELSEVAKATETNASGLGEVKTEITNTKSELTKTIENLKQVTGDLGVQSGLIATNSKELTALKALGDRNYFEFDIKKTKQPVKVGDIAVKLKRADQKRGRYTIDVVADDRTVEKKDRTVNEPLQFYVSGARQPYELVINEVQKDRIAGYLATPKVRESRPTTAKASS